MTSPGLSSCLLFASLLMAGCLQQTHEYYYRNPTDPVSVGVEAAGKAKPSAGRFNTVYLVGVSPPLDPSTAAYPPYDRVRIGSFTGLWAPSAIAWIDATTVNVCPLNRDLKALKSASVLVTETTKRTYRITTDCEAFNRARQRPAT